MAKMCDYWVCLLNSGPCNGFFLNFEETYNTDYANAMLHNLSRNCSDKSSHIAKQYLMGVILGNVS